MRRRTVARLLLAVVALAVVAGACLAVMRLGLPWAPRFSGADFGIEPYVSATDADGDGIDDQTDILASARAYVATNPSYGSAYYAGGWPDDGRGVCTDVVAYALIGAGYDVQTLLDQDVRANPDAYGIEVPDANIDYRRVPNLLVWLTRNATSLTCDTAQIDQWQGGDIVVWDGHIGIVSDVRNASGVPFVIHHWGVMQPSYEEDCLDSWGPVVGHFRIG